MLQNLAKLDYSRGGCYDKGMREDISVYQNKVNKIKEEILMKKKLFSIILCLAMVISLAAYLSEVSFAEGEDDEAVVLNEEEAIDLGEEKTPEAVGAPAALDLATINTIAKDNAGKYYGVKTTGTNDDFGTRKIFYPLTKDQYDEVANDCFMIFKREDGKAFEIPSARLFIDTDPYNPQNAGTIFTELQFRYHVAFQTGILANNDPTNPQRVPGVEGVMWQIDLKDDWIIQKTDGFKTNHDYAPPIDLVFNVTINGHGNRVYRADGSDYNDTYNTIMYLGPSPTVKSTTANIKNLIIDGSEQYRCVILRELGILNVGGSDEKNNEGVEIKDGYSNISSISGGITLLGNSGKKYTKLNVLANPNYTNLKITNCKAPRGGAIYADDNSIVDINNAEFTENKASMGGALYSPKEAYTISIKNSVFSKNKALAIDNDKQMVGGAIVNKSKLTIEDCEFNGNEATNQAGAILFQSNTNVLTIKGSTFTENKSTANAGGAICAYGEVSISEKPAPDYKKSVFSKNKAKWGGAIYDKGNSSIKNAKFNKNYAQYYGGAIYTTKGTTVEYSNFTENQTLQGGGIYIDKNATNSTKVSNTSFEKNLVDYGGAGIFVDKNSKLEVANSTFTKNEGARGAGISSAADGNVNNNLTNIKLDSCTFTDNLSLMGAGIFTAFSTEITNSTFAKNKALVHPQDDQTNPHDSGVGGAIRVMDNKTTIKGSTFEENWAFGSGGALGINGVARDEDKNITTIKPNIKVEISDNTQFIANICGFGQGGAIYTIPYLYDIEGYETGVDKDKLKAEAYKNLSTSADTIFKDNLAISGFVDPPANYTKYTNLAFARNSFTDVLPSEDVAKSLLNNYDVNYKNDKLSAFFDPNGGEFTNGENPKDIRVVKGEKDREITLLDAPKWAGHKFMGWKCSINISKDLLSKLPQDLLDELKKLKEGKIYQAGDKFILDADYIFVAQWDDAPTPKPTEPTTLILTLDENHRGGEITNIEVEEGDLIEPHLYIPRRRGYIFKGWSYDRDHLDEVKPGDRIYTNTTLYAIWKKAEIEREEEPVEIKGEDHITYIFGYPDGSVRPNGRITRAEAAAMLARLLNIEAIGSAAKPQFTDTESSWYNKAINAVVFRGIMKGYPDGRFRPNAPITRAEFTQMISTIDNKPYGVAPFADVPGHWAERAIGSEYQAKRITGYPDGLFRPDANITRAEAAVILNKIFERKYDNLSLLKCKNPQMIKRFTDLDESFWGWNDMVEATNTHEYVRRDINKLPEDWLLIK